MVRPRPIPTRIAMSPAKMNAPTGRDPRSAHVPASPAKVDTSGGLHAQQGQRVRAEGDRGARADGRVLHDLARAGGDIEPIEGMGAAQAKIEVDRRRVARVFVGEHHVDLAGIRVPASENGDLTRSALARQRAVTEGRAMSVVVAVEAKRRTCWACDWG